MDVLTREEIADRILLWGVCNTLGDLVEQATRKFYGGAKIHGTVNDITTLSLAKEAVSLKYRGGITFEELRIVDPKEFDDLVGYIRSGLLREYYLI